MNKFKLTTTQTAVLLAVLTLGTKIFGFLREMFLANYFGAGMITDAYVMGQSIPNTLMAAIVTAVGTAYMPILAARFELGGVKSANKFSSQLLNTLFAITAVVFALALIFSKGLVSIFAPGYSADAAALTVYYMRIAFIALFFHAGITIFEAYLQYKGIFNAQTLIGYLQNIAIIIFIIISAKVDYHLLAVGVVVGFGSRCICDYFVAKKQGFEYSPEFKLSSTIKEVLELALPVFIGGSVSEINTFVDKMLASTLPEGSVSALNYSSTIINVILTFTVSIFVTIVYPKLNKAFATNELDSISRLSERGINLLSLIAIPFAMGAFIYSKEIIHIIYERGAFDATATEMAAIAFRFYAIRIPFYAIAQLIIKVFYSMHDMKTPITCSIASLSVNVILNLILIKSLGIAGLAIATSVADIVGVSLQYLAFRKKHREIKLLSSKKKLVMIVIFSIIAVGISYIVYIALASLSMLLIRLLIAVIAAAISYLAMIYFAKFEELGLIKDLIKH